MSSTDSMLTTQPENQPETQPRTQIVLWKTPEAMLQGWSVIHQMYPLLGEAEYLKRLQGLQGHDYRQFACVTEDNRCLGVVGVWCLPRIWCGLQIDIDNFVVDHEARSMGIGKKLIDRCIEFGIERGASVAVLDTYVDNPSSHRFYFREGFTIRGYHFVKALQGQSIWPNGA